MRARYAIHDTGNKNSGVSDISAAAAPACEAWRVAYIESQMPTTGPKNVPISVLRRGAPPFCSAKNANGCRCIAAIAIAAAVPATRRTTVADSGGSPSGRSGPAAIATRDSVMPNACPNAATKAPRMPRMR